MKQGWQRRQLRLAGIALAATGGLAAALAAAGGTPSVAVQTVDQFQQNGGVFPGYRRNHAQGVCVTGYFQSSGAAARYTVASVFRAGARTPVVGRFSIPGTNPYAWDDVTPIRGMALVFVQADGHQWRTAMNAVPVFPVATPEANLEFLRAQQPVPATGNPDPGKLDAFFRSHPRADAFRRWDRTTPPSASYATVAYNSLDAFYFVDAGGTRRAVRWSMLPTVAANGEAIPAGEPEYLTADLRRRLAQGPLRWHLVVTFAAPGDVVNDATVAWPADRQHVDAGTLVIEASQPQATGVCRDLTFDPLILPAGIEPSADPLLRARAETYTESLRRRLRDETSGRAAALAPASGSTTAQHP